MTANVAPGFAGTPGQSWRDRLRQAAFTAPSGVRIRFSYEDVSRTYDKRGTVFDFPGFNESYVQPGGYGARQYPLRCIFWGNNHDLEATAFEAALLETGIGQLEHPMYGKFNVVPFGSITRNDALKTAANQSIVEVTFWTTVEAVYPSSEPDAQSEIEGALGDFDVAAAQNFAAMMNLLSSLNKASAAATTRGLLQTVSDALGDISAAVTSVNRAFQDLVSEVNFGIDVLIGQPLLLARQVSNLIKAPGRALTGIESRLDGYAALANSIFGSSVGKPSEALSSGTSLLIRTERVANDFHLADLFAMNAMAGSIVSVAAFPVRDVQLGGITIAQGAQDRSGQFKTRPQAIAAAEALFTQFDALIVWREAGFGALDQVERVGNFKVDTGEAYEALQRSVALTAGYLVQSSFSLVPEKRLVLDRPRTLIDLSAQLYKSVSNDRLDQLINSNNLTGSEILELPRGRGIVYYPS